jgi:hypothetical protein
VTDHYAQKLADSLPERWKPGQTTGTLQHSGGGSWAADVRMQLERFEEELGRKLLKREKKALLADAVTAAEHGRHFEPEGALRSYYAERGEDPPNGNTQEGRLDLFTARMDEHKALVKALDAEGQGAA